MGGEEERRSDGREEGEEKERVTYIEDRCVVNGHWK